MKRIKQTINKSNRHAPLVSIIMPVYNVEKYVGEAIESMRGQTFKDFEFIIYDDASTDNTLKIINKYARQDKRIKVFSNARNMGISITTKRAIDETHGDYIARMDGDDISFARRIQKQVEYLESHKKTVAIGTQCQLIDKRGRIIGEKLFPTKHEDIYKYIYRFVPLQQPSLMIARKRLPHDFVFYQDGMNCAEEIELIFKLFKYGKVENLPDTLLKYRIHGKNTSLSNVRETFFLTLISRIKAVVSHGYIPTIDGVFITFAQTIIVLLLPEKIVFNIYKLARSREQLRLPDFSLSLSPKFKLSI